MRLRSENCQMGLYRGMQGRERDWQEPEEETMVPEQCWRLLRMLEEDEEVQAAVVYSQPREPIEASKIVESGSMFG